MTFCDNYHGKSKTIKKPKITSHTTYCDLFQDNTILIYSKSFNNLQLSLFIVICSYFSIKIALKTENPPSS